MKAHRVSAAAAIALCLETRAGLPQAAIEADESSRAHRRSGARSQRGSCVPAAPDRLDRRPRHGKLRVPRGGGSVARDAARGRLRGRSLRGIPARVALAARTGNGARRQPREPTAGRGLLWLGARDQGRGDRPAHRSGRAAEQRSPGSSGPRSRRGGPRRATRDRGSCVPGHARGPGPCARPSRRRGHADPLGQAESHALHVGLRLLSKRPAAGAVGRKGRRAVPATPTGERAGSRGAEHRQHVRHESGPGAQRRRRDQGNDSRRDGARRRPLRFVGLGPGRPGRRRGRRGDPGGSENPEVAEPQAAPNDSLRLLQRRRRGAPRVASLRRGAPERARRAARGADHGPGAQIPRGFKIQGRSDIEAAARSLLAPLVLARCVGSEPRGRLHDGPWAIPGGWNSGLHALGRRRRVRHSPSRGVGHLRQGRSANARPRHGCDGVAAYRIADAPEAAGRRLSAVEATELLKKLGLESLRRTVYEPGEPR